MTLAIEASNLKKTYPPAVTALDGLSLAVEAGTIFALLGPNGAGKSTTVRVLTTLTRPDSGSARVAGIDVLRDPVRVRRAIGVVGQKHGFDPEATGRENLVLGGEFYGITGRELRHRVTASLERFNLAEAAGRLAKTYSGGMQRRLDIALGLLHRPTILFLDEPTTGLDPEARAEMWLEVERLAREELMTILLTTHYMEEADQLAAQVAIVDRGRIVVSGPPEELKRALEGDTIQVELAPGTDGALGTPGAPGNPGTSGVPGNPGVSGSGSDVRLALADVPGVSGVVVQGRVLHARARDGGSAVPAVLAALEARGARAASVTVARPSLDEVYLRHAGRAFRQAELEHERVPA